MKNEKAGKTKTHRRNSGANNQANPCTGYPDNCIGHAVKEVGFRGGVSPSPFYSIARNGGESNMKKGSIEILSLVVFFVIAASLHWPKIMAAIVIINSALVIFECIRYFWKRMRHES